MGTLLKAVVIDDDTISIDGRLLLEQGELGEVLRSAVQADPGLVLVIEPRKATYYKGIGKVIYASQRAGVPVENLRYQAETGEALTFDELKSRRPD